MDPVVTVFVVLWLVGALSGLASANVDGRQQACALDGTP